MTGQSIAERSHEYLHRLPGMPEHGASMRLNHRAGLPNRPLRNRSLRNRPLRSPRINHGYREPKVLVGWQNAIARFFASMSR
jgi:hypothetical protein